MRALGEERTGGRQTETPVGRGPLEDDHNVPVEANLRPKPQEKCATWTRRRRRPCSMRFNLTAVFLVVTSSCQNGRIRFSLVPRSVFWH